MFINCCLASKSRRNILRTGFQQQNMQNNVGWSSGSKVKYQKQLMYSCCLCRPTFFDLLQIEWRFRQFSLSVTEKSIWRLTGYKRRPYSALLKVYFISRKLLGFLICLMFFYICKECSVNCTITPRNKSLNWSLAKKSGKDSPGVSDQLEHCTLAKLGAYMFSERMMWLMLLIGIW